MPPADWSYFIPRARLEGRSAEMAFADAVYCVVAEQGQPARRDVNQTLGLKDAYAFDLNFVELTRLTGLDRGTITEEINTADKAGWLRWSTIGDHDKVEVYLPGYAAIAGGAGAVHKPRNYVRNGWLQTVYRLGRSYLLQRVLNVVWLMRFDDGWREINVDEIRARATPQNGRPVNRPRVLDALETLEQLGLLTPQGNAYWLDRECFDRPAPTPETVTTRHSRRSIVESEAFGRLLEQDAARASLAVEVLTAGRFDPEQDLAAIFRDLQWVGPETELLLRLARRRPKHKGAPQWPDFWHNYLKYRREERASRERVRSAQFVARFDDTSEQAGLLGLLGPSVDNVEALWLTARLQRSFAVRQKVKSADRQPQVRINVRAGSTTMLDVIMGVGEHLQRPLPLKTLNARDALHFSFYAYAPEPTPGLWLEAWLEAAPRPIPSNSAERNVPQD